MLKILSKTALVLILFGFLSAGFSQDNKAAVISRTADKVSQKLLLSPEQTAKIKDLLAAEFDKIKKNDVAEVNTKVESLLNDKQKEKFSIIKKDWLSPIVSKK